MKHKAPQPFWSIFAGPATAALRIPLQCLLTSFLKELRSQGSPLPHGPAYTASTAVMVLEDPTAAATCTQLHDLPTGVHSTMLCHSALLR